MPKISDISYEEFRDAVRRLTQQSKKPTFSNLRQELGRGSYDVLRRFLDQHASEQGDAARADLPAPLLASVVDWYQEMLDAARERARAEFADQVEALEAQRAQIEEQNRKLRDRAVAAEESQQSQVTDFAITRVRLAHAEEDLAGQRATIARLENDLAAAAARSQALTEQVAQQQSNHTAAVAAHGQELALAEERMRGLERVLLQRHDAEMRGFRERAQDLEHQLEICTARRDAFERQAVSNREALIAAQAKAEAADQRIQAQSQEVGRLAAELTVAREAVAQARAEVSSVDRLEQIVAGLGAGRSNAITEQSDGEGPHEMPRQK